MRKLRAERRGAAAPRPLSIPEVLQWAKAYYRANGTWPHQQSGPIPGTDENWQKVDHALRVGGRGLPCIGSLSQLMAEYRNRRKDAHPKP